MTKLVFTQLDNLDNSIQNNSNYNTNNIRFVLIPYALHILASHFYRKIILYFNTCMFTFVTPTRLEQAVTTLLILSDLSRGCSNNSDTVMT